MDKDSSTLWLLGIVEQRVLVVVEPANYRDDEEEEYDDPSVHPVDEDKDEDCGTTDPPELPEEKSE